ncbi:MAG: hypothetical protein ABL886_07705, partial [Rhodoglobus sp.]
MANDDEVTGEPSYDPASNEPGARRATYTPPTEATSLPVSDEPIHDDDELANALSAEMGRLATGSFAAIRDEPVREPMPMPEPAPEPEPTDAQPVAEPDVPAWMSLPAPDPAQAVLLPDGPPERVVTDPEMLGLLERAGLEPGGTLSVIEQLQAQREGRESPLWLPHVADAPVADAPADPPVS